MHPIRHFITITRHRHRVIRNAFKAGIGFQGLFHDLSKYTPTEFIAGAKYYAGTKSPNEAEREVYGYSPAWLHHKGRNKHHFEYWMDYSVNRQEGIVGMKMPINYVAEMFCDRLAASKNYQKEKYTQNHPWAYYEHSKHRTIIHPETREILEKLLLMLKEEGEDATFTYIKKELLKR